MELLDPVSLTGAGRDLGLLLWFRGAPIAGWALASARVGWRMKFALCAAGLGLSLGLRVWSALPLGWVCWSCGYFAAAASALPALSRGLRSGWLARAPLFALCLLLFLIVPSALLPASARSALLLLGWDFMLASYSYCVEGAKRTQLPLRECLFFVLINPALVYSERGAQLHAPALHARGVVRVALGLCALFIAFALLRPACAAVREAAAHAGRMPAVACALLAFGMLRLSLEYCQHSGLASLQIGLLRQLGYELPERYRWPLLARDPLDFFRRWNTYVGGWAARYVFTPLAYAAQRRWSFRAAALLGVLVTFTAVGALHDLYMSAVLARPVFQGLCTFSAIGGLVAAWAAAARALRRSQTRFPNAFAGAVGARVLFWALAIGCMVWGWA